MRIDFDPTKDKLNLADHGLSLSFARDLAWDEALVWVDERYEYDELRIIGLVRGSCKTLQRGSGVMPQGLSESRIRIQSQPKRIKRADRSRFALVLARGIRRVRRGTRHCCENASLVSHCSNRMN